MDLNSHESNLKLIFSLSLSISKFLIMMTFLSCSSLMKQREIINVYVKIRFHFPKKKMEKIMFKINN